MVGVITDKDVMRCTASGLNPAESRVEQFMDGSYETVHVDADDLAMLIEKLHLGPVHLVGHSYGALGALLFATQPYIWDSALRGVKPGAIENSINNSLAGSINWNVQEWEFP